MMNLKEIFLYKPFKNNMRKSSATLFGHFPKREEKSIEVGGGNGSYLGKTYSSI